MNINALLADLDNTRRMMGVNIGNVLANPKQAIGNILSRYAYENLPTSLEVQDAQSVMPGMGNAYSGKMNALATNYANPLGTVLRPPITRWGGPLMDAGERVLYNGQKVDLGKMSYPEQWLATAYSGRLAEGFPPNRAAEWAAVHGAMHPEIGPEHVSNIMPRLSPAQTTDAEVIPMPQRWMRF